MMIAMAIASVLPPSPLLPAGDSIICPEQGFRQKSRQREAGGVQFREHVFPVHLVAANTSDGGACVPEILTAQQLEPFVAGVMGPELFEPREGASVGEDVEEAQELAMDATRGADDAGQEDVGDTQPRVVGLPVAVHLGARCGLEKLVGLVVPERPVEAHIGQVIASKARLS